MKAQLATNSLKSILTSIITLIVIFAVNTNSAYGQGGKVFALTNNVKGNEVVVFNRASDGTLSEEGKVLTGGNGISTPLNSQGALILNADNSRLYAVNPGNDQITAFAVGQSLSVLQQIRSAGDLPVSLTTNGNKLFVLNAGSGGGIFGYNIKPDGKLTPIFESRQMLTTPVGAPAQIQFHPNGGALVVTHKVTDLVRPPNLIIDTFTVDQNGVTGPPTPFHSVGIEPFGFAIRSDGTMVVSEAFNGAPQQSAVSSYSVSPTGVLSLISGSVPNNQTASCWIVITNNGQFAYVTNTGSGTISSYTVAPDGSLTLLNAVAADLGAGALPIDMDISADGLYLYALLSGTGQVAALSIANDGSLTPIARSGGIPAMKGASGLAAF